MFILCIPFWNLSAIGQSSLDSIGNIIMDFNFQYYEGKPVDSLIYHLPAGYSNVKFHGHLTSNKVQFLAIEYPGNILVCVHVFKYRYMNPVDQNRMWDLDLYKKEEIGEIDVVNPY